MTFKRALLVALAMSLVGGVLASNAANEWDKKTVLTLSRDVEVPGYVLPAGTYTFQLVDPMSDRHMVRISQPVDQTSSSQVKIALFGRS